MTTRRDFLKATVAAPVLPAVIAAAPAPEPAKEKAQPRYSPEEAAALFDQLYETSNEPEQAKINATYSRIIHGIRSLLGDVESAIASDILPEGTFRDEGDDDGKEEELEEDLRALEYNLRLARDFIPTHLAGGVVYPRDCPCLECFRERRNAARAVHQALKEGD
jgi:hypothetical protein